ncbi:dynamin family protein [Bacillus sp. V3B]|uniref:dynamin family protein n=1 Tax=Bacillus sp. V3B TaxID=2804915 RepID=UPI00210B3CC2|nr:dynamin family protein [Bacillus sp. V3B]MCQ6274780.1 dynamin family protein [Bacillus sp. V3B]
MNIREQWNEQAVNVERSFEQALTIAREAKDCFADYLVIDEEQKVLNTQWSNWKNNRFEIVVVGEFSTGKSTFINALLRKNVLPSKVTPTTATINFIRHIEQGDGKEKAIITFVDGNKLESSFDQLEEYVTEMSKEHNVVEEISYVELFVDSPYLKEGVVIVDTPGLQALHPEHERITKNQIKKSNASILLFNMEQPGKRSEFMFLKDLSDSIERIFFVGNRMDGVPENEISDVIHALESALKENEYQPISTDQAKVFPISALQALKARDEDVQTKHWNDLSNEQLIEASQFMEFEQRLEDYLFNGEKTKDLIHAPYQALQYFYQQLEAKINEIEVLISGEISVEELKKEKERLTEEVELRKLQLQDQERNLKNLFQDVLYEHEKSFNARKDHVMQHMVDQINEIEFIDDLEDEVSNVMLQLNKDFQQRVDQGIRDLSNQLEMKMRREIDGFELSIEEYSKDNIQTLTDKDIKVSTKINASKSQASFEIKEEKFAEEAVALEEQRKLLQDKQEQEQQLDRLKRRQDLIKNSHQREESFVDMLLQSTDAIKKEYGVIKERRFWFDKKGMVDVKNEDYEKLIKEKRELMKKAINEENNLYAERSQIDRNLALNDLEFDSLQDYYEAKRQLQKRREAERLERFRERTKLEERQLKREQKKVIREIENVFESLRREYRSLLRSLDALKLAQQGIESYIQEKDVELNVKLKDLESKGKLLDENAQKQESYRVNAETIYAKVGKENESITNFLLECY